MNHIRVTIDFDGLTDLNLADEHQVRYQISLAMEKAGKLIFMGDDTGICMSTDIPRVGYTKIGTFKCEWPTLANKASYLEA